MKMKTLSRIGITESSDDLLHLLRAAVDTMDELLPQTAEALLTRHEIEIARAGGMDITADRAELSDSIKSSTIRYAAIMRCSVTVEEAARALGRDPSRIRQRLGKGTLYGIKLAGQWRIPVFQFVQTGKDALVEIPGINEVLSAISPDAHPVAVIQWFTTPNTELWDDDADQPMRPIDWLQREEPMEPIRELAHEL